MFNVGQFAGDVDADGFADVIAGARGEYSPTSGVTALFLGPHAGRQTLEYADALLVGEQTEAWAGSAVDGAGDVDGDDLRVDAVSVI
jgi:hypothetical protein